jgi:hypothetical protein
MINLGGHHDNLERSNIWDAEDKFRSIYTHPRPDIEAARGVNVLALVILNLPNPFARGRIIPAQPSAFR